MGKRFYGSLDQAGLEQRCSPASFFGITMSNGLIHIDLTEIKVIVIVVIGLSMLTVLVFQETSTKNLIGVIHGIKNNSICNNV
uniref:Transmembrane protein n=1 Tax=Arabidopsis thaliana TaxID=3702 RepID=Q9FHW5_ARATH|nr:unnamed protein product [Arabidopsis thaliana]